MPNTIEFGIDAATLILVIGPKTYVLKSQPMTIHIPGSPADQRFHFKYEGNYDDSIDLGTPEAIVQSIEDMFKAEGVPLPTGTDSLVKQWERLQQGLQSVPFFEKVVSTVATTRVQITEIEARLTPKKENGKDHYESEFRFGLMFTPSQRPRLFNIQVQAFGATLRLKVTVEKEKLVQLLPG